MIDTVAGSPLDPSCAAGDRAYPVCFIRGSRLAAQTVLVSLDGGGAALPALTIEGRSTDLRLMGPLAVVGGVGISDPLQSVALEGGGIASLENTVGVEQRAISWLLHWGRDGRTTWRSIGNSSNLLYRVGGPPTTQTLYEGLLHIGCNAARGWPRRNVPEGDPDQDEQKLVDYIWAAFADRDVRRTDGARLGYYRGILCPADCSIIEAPGLISTTNGQCGSWADLFIRCLEAEAVTNVRLVRVDPLSTIQDCHPANAQFEAGFLVKNYDFVGGGQSGCGNYPYRINDPCAAAGSPWLWSAVDVTDAYGLSGQDSANPASYFGRHFIVNHGNRYFDPSNGAGPFVGTPEQAAMGWENASIAGYFGFGTVTVQDQGFISDVARQGGAVREIHFTVLGP